MSNKELSFKRFINLTAFVGLLLVATALIVRHILNWAGISAQIVQYIADIGSLIAALVLIVVAYSYVKTKRKPIWMVLYAVATTVVIILQILNFVF